MPFENIVAEQTLTSGTGPYTPNGSILNTRTLSAALTNGVEYGYRVTYLDGVTPGYEIGRGIWDGSLGRLQRDTIENSSNADALVNWGVGTKLIEITLTAGQLNALESSYAIADSETGGNWGDISGIIDGVNQDFILPTTYVAGTLEIMLSGQDQKSSDILETSPAAGTYTLSFAPRSGEYMKARYR